MDSDIGRISVSSNLYRQLEYSFSGTGQKSDTECYLGANDYPRWQTNTTIAYSLKKVTTSLNISTVSDTVRYSGATPATVENNVVLARKGYAIYNLYLGYDLTDDLQLRFNVNNVADKRYVDQRDGSLYSSIGRTFQFAVNAKF
jgi:outer membrane receptor protein involved in Fe transport